MASTTLFNEAVNRRRSPARILIVEDERIVALDLAATLAELGYAVADSVGSGEVAIERAAELRPDLVLMDIRLGGNIDGIQAAAEIRKRTGAPVIYLTAHSDAPTLERAKHSEAFGYLVKPFKDTEIRSTIEIALYKHETEEALRRSEKKFRQVLEAASEAILEVDAEGRILLLNETAEKMFGYTREELLQLKVDGLVPAAARGLHARHRADYAGMPRTRTMGIGLELHAQRKDGSLFPVEIGLSPSWSDGVLRTIVLVHDVTVRKNAEEALRKSEEALRQVQKLEALARLAGGTAHEFNNLLTMVMGYAALMLSALDSRKMLIDYIEKITKTSRRAAELIRQLLAFSRKQVLTPQLLDLNTVLAETWDVLPSLLGSDIEATIIPARAAARVLADRSQIHQVIVNLVTNACEAMPSGGRLTLEVVNTELQEQDARHHPGLSPGKYVVLAVKDTGIGMPSEVQTRLFEPFFSTKEFGKGAGLGLAAIYGIVQQSGGSISVESEPGVGATFKVFLPRVSEEPIVSGRVPGDLPESLRGTETILLVEDLPQLRMLTREFLEKLGYNVLEASDAEEAIQVAEGFKGHIALLLTDVVMPGMNGRELVHKLKPRRPEMKILFVSGYTHDAFAGDQIADPDDAFLDKPFVFEELAQKIRKVLNSGSLPPQELQMVP